MTGNVAQEFLTDTDWSAALIRIHIDRIPRDAPVLRQLARALRQVVGPDETSLRTRRCGSEIATTSRHRRNRTGVSVDGVRCAPDRPRREFVFLAHTKRRPATAGA